jgi:hypothetical protein
MNPQNQPFELKIPEPDQIPRKNQVVDFAVDKIPVKSPENTVQRPITPGFQNSGVGVSPTNSLNSLNFGSNSSGWGLSTNGDAQFNGNRVVSSHFTPCIQLKGNTIYISDGTSPNGTLSGSTGDIVFHGDGGKMYFCVGGTTWTAPA